MLLTQQVEAQAPTVQQGWPLLPVNQTGTSDSVQTQDRPHPPQLSPIFQTLHWPYGAMPLRYWQSDNRPAAAVLPHLRATQKGNLARPHSCSPQAVQKPEGPAMHCHLHWGDWSFHLTNEKKKKNYAAFKYSSRQMTGKVQVILSFTLPSPLPTAFIHLSPRLSSSTAECSAPSVPSIVLCLLLFCSRWFPPSLLFYGTHCLHSLHLKNCLREVLIKKTNKQTTQTTKTNQQNKAKENKQKRQNELWKSDLVKG